MHTFTVFAFLFCYGMADHDWWKKSIIYQIYPRSFQDSNGDGTGDLQGIESRLDYIKELGVGAVWLSPIYKSPMKDFGYDIEDFKDIAPVFGTMEDFRSLSRAMKQRDIKLLLDFIPNHSSDQHEWFKKSLMKQEPYTDYYVWADAKGVDDDGKPMPPNNWKAVFGGSAWEWKEERQQFYLHQFLKQQPDLNYRNPKILQKCDNILQDVLQFWLDQGVDGFRVDASPHLFEDEQLRDEPLKEEGKDDGSADDDDYGKLDHIYTYNLPQVLNVLREFRILLDHNSVNQTKIMIVETYLPVDKVMDYYGNKTRSIAHFPFNFELITSISHNITAAKVYNIIQTWMEHMPQDAWANWMVGNHDKSRVATRFGPELVDAMNMITMLLPGTPVVYNGEEMGMEDTDISWRDTKDSAGINAGPTKYKLFSRDPERTPMQWNSGKNAGFSTANQTWLPVNPNYVSLNAEAQLAAEWSHIKVFKLLVAARKAEAVMMGKLDIQVLKNNLLVFTRVKEGHPGYMVVVNFSNKTETVDLTKMAHVPDISTVYVFSITYAHQFSVRSRISNKDVTMPGIGGLVLMFVPQLSDYKVPIPL
ncbi:hypothetical protein L9F63_012685 [Diploptera punctata]|uniref:alpha-glucosidase n=1 Tax=Diploptera punctata TaxID=6984 RepID=A0AAD8ACG0_DIPPU|nr:hypothetical protein L9F63_012685 [Diploptera punctata]